MTKPFKLKLAAHFDKTLSSHKTEAAAMKKMADWQKTFKEPWYTIWVEKDD